MVHAVEELLQVHVHHPAPALLDVAAAPLAPRRARCVPVGSRSCARENVGSKIGCSTCSRACWMNRSSTVGMPSVVAPRRRPSGSPAASPAAAGSVPASSCSRSRLPVRPQVGRQLVHGHPVDAGTALVLLPLASARPAGWRARPPAPSAGRRFLSVRFLSPPSGLRRCAVPSGLHPYPPARLRCSDFWAVAFEVHGAFRSPHRSALRRPRAGYYGLC